MKYCCIFLAFFFNLVDALYFYLNEGGEKCFIQELPRDTLLVGSYRCLPLTTNQSRSSTVEGLGMMVEIKDPAQKTVLSREYRSEGHFTYKSHDPGEHLLCLHAKGQKFVGKKLKIDFDLQTGEHAINYTVLQKKEKLNEIETKFKQLVEKAAAVTKEQDYQRYREELFRGTTETISQRVLYWSVGETIILILMGIWQMQNLRGFFESKKLV
ncbi:transmembrane emp24 domain-containing protein 4-like [Uloborus diversus]|uniref:transmembrane emp24 domain-containing protein 4-like n=1 Tax=Uloborus diversus TaxID=327109 RepID=UPI00240A0094|nr:transmembrane emp24 domain-containing protein 4-like [Uloborus diversus]